MRTLRVTGTLADDPAVRVIELAAPMAFCAGWLRPRVYVSTGGLSRLSPDELAAVLAHEHHHKALRDPLRLAVGAVLSQALFFLPVLRPLHERYGDVAELRADAAARDAPGRGHRSARLGDARLRNVTVRAASSASRPSGWTPCSAARARGTRHGCRSSPGS